MNPTAQHDKRCKYKVQEFSGGVWVTVMFNVSKATAEAIKARGEKRGKVIRVTK